MGIVTDHIQLLILRLINGAMAGFGPAAIAFVATNTPEERNGYALGMLHSGAVAGTICGPLLGGVLSDLFGFNAIFTYMGICILAATIIVLFWIKENFERVMMQGKSGFIQDFLLIVSRKPVAYLFVSAVLIRAAMVGTLPLIPLYVQHLAPNHGNLALLVGIAAAAMGIANMIAAPQLGKLSDKVGPYTILTFVLFGAILD